MKKLPFYFFITFLAARTSAGSANDVALGTEDRPYAPLDVSKGAHEDPYRTLSREEREGLLSEFKGLVHMGMQKAAYERWSGKSMSDCEFSQDPSTARAREDRWQYKCEIITGQGNGFYYFYPTESRRAATLQRVEVRLHSGDRGLFGDVRRSLQNLFGRSYSTQGRCRWETAEDVAELFIEGSLPDKTIRFVWNRAPLTSTRQAFNK